MARQSSREQKQRRAIDKLQRSTNEEIAKARPFSRSRERKKTMGEVCDDASLMEERKRREMKGVGEERGELGATSSGRDWGSSPPVSETVALCNVGNVGTVYA